MTMASLYAQSATNIGGSCEEFVQTDFIAAQGWGDKDPKKRGGALTAGNGFSDGVCLGLSILYVGCRADWSIFKQMIKSPGGLAHIRGMMNFQSVFREGGNQAMGTIEKDHEIHAMMLRTLGRVASGKKRSAFNALGAEGIASFCSSHEGLHLICIGGGGQAHAIAALTQSNSLILFDPNFGAATIPKQHALLFINWVMSTYYSSLSNYWMVSHYVF